MQTIHILENRDERIAEFQKVVATLGSDFQLRLWQDVHSMIAAFAECFPNAALFSLDPELDRQPGVDIDPGTGLDVAREVISI